MIARCPKCLSTAVVVNMRVAVLDEQPPTHVEDVSCAACGCILKRTPMVVPK